MVWKKKAYDKKKINIEEGSTGEFITSGTRVDIDFQLQVQIRSIIYLRTHCLFKKYFSGVIAFERLMGPKLNSFMPKYLDKKNALILAYNECESIAVSSIDPAVYKKLLDIKIELYDKLLDLMLIALKAEGKIYVDDTMEII